jgi:hypothetical protein
MVAAARSRRYGLVGTAFDYLLRFELQRQAERTVGRHWVAEHAPRVLRAAADGGRANISTTVSPGTEPGSDAEPTTAPR